MNKPCKIENTGKHYSFYVKREYHNINFRQSLGRAFIDAEKVITLLNNLRGLYKYER